MLLPKSTTEDMYSVWYDLNQRNEKNPRNFFIIICWCQTVHSVPDSIHQRTVTPESLVADDSGTIFSRALMWEQRVEWTFLHLVVQFSDGTDVSKSGPKRASWSSRQQCHRVPVTKKRHLGDNPCLEVAKSSIYSGRSIYSWKQWPSHSLKEKRLKGLLSV